MAKAARLRLLQVQQAKRRELVAAVAFSNLNSKSSQDSDLPDLGYVSGLLRLGHQPSARVVELMTQASVAPRMLLSFWTIVDGFEVDELLLLFLQRSYQRLRDFQSLQGLL